MKLTLATGKIIRSTTITFLQIGQWTYVQDQPKCKASQKIHLSTYTHLTADSSKLICISLRSDQLYTRSATTSF